MKNMAFDVVGTAEVTTQTVNATPVKKSEGVKPDHDADQVYALKRIVSIAEGHLKHNFKSPELCQAINQIYDLSTKLLKEYYASRK